MRVLLANWTVCFTFLTRCVYIISDPLCSLEYSQVERWKWTITARVVLHLRLFAVDFHTNLSCLHFHWVWGLASLDLLSFGSTAFRYHTCPLTSFLVLTAFVLNCPIRDDHSMNSLAGVLVVNLRTAFTNLPKAIQMGLLSLIVILHGTLALAFKLYFFEYKSE